MQSLIIQYPICDSEGLLVFKPGDELVLLSDVEADHKKEIAALTAECAAKNTVISGLIERDPEIKALTSENKKLTAFWEQQSLTERVRFTRAYTEQVDYPEDHEATLLLKTSTGTGEGWIAKEMKEAQDEAT